MTIYGIPCGKVLRIRGHGKKLVIVPGENRGEEIEIHYDGEIYKARYGDKFGFVELEVKHDP